ncbi:putative Ubiquitin domain, BAG domain superfamily, molecular chaperone regulator BAG [Helianthus annuus]|uniref:Putative ubiquitin-related domain-containing protein n=1 Tax=Helianthus annuus TaxID=4232 RepID=A0A251TP21_HELAN|nr:BAG family molecular chaperone regulator 1 [Helianthus annuus]XP_021990138.1 BAG family molecular chaperone regulator 1 [Helianthus annuus]XP_021990139.1 BAG family molecular chaperone regulator 1 [Helianthus annuus]XP_021990140.1 BAG family molecular chaperone regulator 1 [Helianthus annuus]XP_021990141.1 BAG family molecular chaperone regulator 1 [Helianthus annuus]XP_035834701.1 BAG family molecular chaperone regulator 1 [Helianthus annuus]KAF5788212.1 putative Ubiquitin domain, BAG dom
MAAMHTTDLVGDRWLCQSGERICSSNRVNWASTYTSQNNTYNKKTLVANNPLTIRVRVKYGSIYHGINNSSQATFGELKKMLLGPTGLHHEDQKLMYKNKERSSKTFLDVVGVKDLSKMVLVEDPISQERRYVEMRKNAMMEKAAKAISQISLEVDRLAGQATVRGHDYSVGRHCRADKTIG